MKNVSIAMGAFLLFFIFLNPPLSARLFWASDTPAEEKECPDPIFKMKKKSSFNIAQDHHFFLPHQFVKLKGGGLAIARKGGVLFFNAEGGSEREVKTPGENPILAL
ncbi:MAG: hypothetical protein OXB88_11385, partial [Bacteriovoracales bacterium]|nr:hypothetical protein [Bacteriovoracales bacterium]